MLFRSGSVQIKKLDGFIAARRRNYEALEKALTGLRGVNLLQSTGGRFQSSYYCLSIVLDDKLADKRLQLVKRLNAEGVGTSVYYPQPVPRMTYYREKYGWANGSFPGAARIADCSIALPVGPHLNGEDIAYIADIVKRCVAEIAV